MFTHNNEVFCALLTYGLTQIFAPRLFVGKFCTSPVIVLRTMMNIMLGRRPRPRMRSSHVT